MNAIALLFLAGILLLAFEVLTPGGILGVLGGLAMAGGCGIAFVRFGTGAGVAATLIALALVGLVVWLELVLLPKTRFGRKMFQHEAIRGTSQPAVAASAEVVGQMAEAVTTLAPSGYVTVGGRQYEAWSQSGYTAKGASVRIVGLDNFRLIVTQS